MAVGKRDTARAIVIAGGYVDHLKAAGIPRVEPGHVHDEKTVIDSVFSYVGDQPDTGRTWHPHVGNLAHDFVLSLSVPRRVGIQPAVHRDAADARVEPAAVPRHAPVRRTTPDAQRLVERPKVALHEVHRVGVVRYWLRVIEPAHHPGHGGSGAV